VGEQLIFAATSRLWRYIAERETETTSDWVLDPTPDASSRTPPITAGNPAMYMA
jgi:hypothetical protein